MKLLTKKTLITAITSASIAISGLALAAGDQAMSDQSEMQNKSQNMEQKSENKMSEWSQEAKDAYMHGKIESTFMLNEHLSAFKIDTDVENGSVMLTGNVNSEASKELAGEIAEGMQDVQGVNNQLTVAKDSKSQAQTAQKSEKRSFGTVVSDATLTASVKMKLIGSEAEAMDINVDSKNGTVTLNGNVKTQKLSDLAEKIAKNTKGASNVDNKLVVKEEVSVR